MEQVVCNLCGNSETVVQWVLPDSLLGRRDVCATFVQCTVCRLIYQNPRPTLGEMAAHYPPEYEPYVAGPDTSSSWLQRQSNRYGLGKRARAVTRYKQSGRLLDLGCGPGVFLRGMRDRGNWQVYGVEINEHAAQIARTRHRLDIYTGTLEQASFPDGFFDVITMWDVLEHLHDPAASLRELYRVLKPDGVLLIRVPNVDSWDAAVFGRYWAGLDAPRHLYVFSPLTLETLLNNSGFQIQGCSSGTGAYPTFLLSLRFWSQAHRKPGAAPGMLVQWLQQPIMRLLTAPVFYFAGLNLHGPLMLVAATKPCSRLTGAGTLFDGKRAC